LLSDYDSESSSEKSLTLAGRQFADYESVETAFEANELSESELKHRLKEFLNDVLCNVQVALF
jgi:hypothetical protein